MARKFRNELVVSVQGCWRTPENVCQAPAFKVVFSTLEVPSYRFELGGSFDFSVGFHLRPNPSFRYQQSPSLFPPSLSFALYWWNPFGAREFFSLMDVECCCLTKLSKACVDRVRSLISVH